jgi:hypothetical protein
VSRTPTENPGTDIPLIMVVCPCVSPFFTPRNMSHWGPSAVLNPTNHQIVKRCVGGTQDLSRVNGEEIPE